MSYTDTPITFRTREPMTAEERQTLRFVLLNAIEHIELGTLAPDERAALDKLVV